MKHVVKYDIYWDTLLMVSICVTTYLFLRDPIKQYHLAAGIGFNFNVLRILRLARIVRLARALRLIGELKTIVSSIAGSLRPLFWTAVLIASP